jgi:hypothetical protein
MTKFDFTDLQDKLDTTSSTIDSLLGPETSDSSITYINSLIESCNVLVNSLIFDHDLLLENLSLLNDSLMLSTDYLNNLNDVDILIIENALNIIYEDVLSLESMFNEANNSYNLDILPRIDDIKDGVKVLSDYTEIPYIEIPLFQSN